MKGSVSSTLSFVPFSPKTHYVLPFHKLHVQKKRVYDLLNASCLKYCLLYLPSTRVFGASYFTVTYCNLVVYALCIFLFLYFLISIVNIRRKSSEKFVGVIKGYSDTSIEFLWPDNTKFCEVGISWFELFHQILGGDVMQFNWNLGKISITYKCPRI